MPSVCGPFSFSTASVRASTTHGKLWPGNFSLWSSMTSSSRVPNMEGWKGASCEGAGVCVHVVTRVQRLGQGEKSPPHLMDHHVVVQLLSTFIYVVGSPLHAQSPQCWASSRPSLLRSVPSFPHVCDSIVHMLQPAPLKVYMCTNVYECV